MTPSPFQSKILEHRLLCPGAYELTLERNDLSFLPGQLINIHGDQLTEDRCYSIASGSKDPYLTVLYRLIPDGTLTPKLSQKKAGDTLTLSGPYGQFTLRSLSQPVVFVATGTGIAPCRSFFRSHPDLHLTLIMGARTREELFYAEEFAACTYLPCLSRESQNEFPHRVTEVIQEIEDDGQTQYYLCGAFEMIFDVSRILQDRGVDDSRIFSEEYYYRFNA